MPAIPAYNKRILKSYKPNGNIHVPSDEVMNNDAHFIQMLIFAAINFDTKSVEILLGRWLEFHPAFPFTR